MKVYLFVPILFIIASCSNSDPVVESNVSEIFSAGQIELNGFLGDQYKPDSLLIDRHLGDTSNVLLVNDLSLSLQLFDQTRKRIDLEKSIAIWEDIKLKENILSHSQLVLWNELNAKLLQITGDSKYGSDLDQTLTHFISSETYDGDIIEKITPVIFTKDVDNVYVNIFTPSKIHFQHSLGGKVGIEQISDDFQSGNIELHFNMDEKQYLELYIRIPEWAKNPTVIVKKVKYLAIAGEYCKIAKKWKEGDIVELYFKPT